MKRITVIFFLIILSLQSHAEDITECDRLVAHPSDPDHVGVGVSSGDVDTKQAIEACKAAVKVEPDNPRFRYQLGRALVYEARKTNADTDAGVEQLKIAADADYTQALFVLGLMHRSAGDVCASEPVTRRAAQQGLKAARIAYANAIAAGDYAACASTAGPGEVHAFLQQAKDQVSGYYENMLWQNLHRQLPYIAPLTKRVWNEAIVSVTDLDRSARFFVEIGGYEEKWRGPLSASEIEFWGLDSKASGEALLLGPAGQDTGMVRLIRFDDAGRKAPTRPGARAWDTGCYFSLMIRMKDMPAIYDDAIELGWWSETPMTKLSFGESRLNVMVFLGPDGMQVQGYERLQPPLPVAIPEFDRLTRPFNIMQMVRDRDAAYSFFTDVLGFDTFYVGKPYVSPEPVYMPLGIPKNLTTSVRYRAGIVYPVAGEFGRMEMIEVMDLEGQDYADRCVAPNLGILAVRYPVDDIDSTVATLEERQWPLDRQLQDVDVAPYGATQMLSIKTPDGSNIHFMSDED